MNGVIVYNGPSIINGENIVAVATGISTPTENRDTGDMLQIWYMMRELDPVSARSQRSTCKGIGCGTCPAYRFCYVVDIQASLSIWHCVNDGRYPSLSEGQSLHQYAQEHIPPYRLRGLGVRLGAVGDPMSVGLDVTNNVILNGFTKWSGYTNQWRGMDRASNTAWANIVMASCISPLDMLKAKQLGYRTFRIRSAAGKVLSTEAVCPKTPEAGRQMQCCSCLGCMGNASKGHGTDYTVIVHGAKKTRFKVVEG
jgi:hypothetical protein